MNWKIYFELIVVFLLTFVHAEVYTLLEAVVASAQGELASTVALLLLGIITFVFFIIFYKKIEVIFKYFKKYEKGKYLLPIFGLLIIYFNIILIYFTIPGLIHLITTLLLFERTQK